MILRWKEKTYHLSATPDGLLGIEDKRGHRVLLRRKPERLQIYEVVPHSRRTQAMARFYFFKREGIFEAY